MRITLVLRGGTNVTANLEAADQASNPESDCGSVYLESLGNQDELREFPCEEIVAFCLRSSAPIDQSDELRG